MTREQQALIVGAGIGGLAAGLALSLAPNARLARRELGIADEVAARGAAAGPMEIRGDGGRVWKRFTVAAAVGQVPSLFAARDALHGALVGADGVASVIRARLHPGEPPPRPSGYFALRAVARGATHTLTPYPRPPSAFTSPLRPPCHNLRDPRS